jgi:MinD superfamily P-loop ATPase
MPYKIAIASGKGGTGKTTVSVSLFHYLQESRKGMVQLVDCDVEEPNDILFFPEAEKRHEDDIYQRIPEIDTEKCTFCRKCVEFCEFNAIVVIPPAQFAEVNASLCHSCGACLVACPHAAISESPWPIGKVNYYNTLDNEDVIEGELVIGSAMQTMLIKEVKKKATANKEILLFDAPPGTSCPVVETISDADFVILVAEPTPFGLHDLKLMIGLMEEIKKPYGLIINKAGLGNEAIYDFVREKEIPLLGEIPFSREYAALYADGNLSHEVPGNIKNSYLKVIDQLERRVLIHA